MSRDTRYDPPQFSGVGFRQLDAKEQARVECKLALLEEAIFFTPGADSLAEPMERWRRLAGEGKILVSDIGPMRDAFESYGIA